MSAPTISEFLSLDRAHQQAQIHQRLVDAITALSATLDKNQDYSIIGAGTAYSLTNTAAALDLGTTDPVLTLGLAGTYLLNAVVDLDAVGATVVAETATVKLRRTNNTATDLTGAGITIDLPVMTTLTHTLGRYGLGPTIYTTTATDDALTVFGNVSATLGAGVIKATFAKIVAIRLY